MPLLTQILNYSNTYKAQCLEAFKSNIPIYFAEEEYTQFESFLDTVNEKESTKDPDWKTYFYVILHNNKLIGCGGFGYKPGNNFLTLAWGLVHSAYHKQGFGKHLLLYRLQAIQQLYPDAPLYIDTTQHSRGFFEKFGFITTQITENFYAPGLHRYDMVLQPARV